VSSRSVTARLSQSAAAGPDMTIDEHRRSRQIAPFSETSSATAPVAPLA
jgi:hypothetical protein